jgi:myo-inositol catabolism protein IolC
LSISLATLAAFAGRREGFRAVAKLKTHAKLVENLAVDLIRRHQHLQCPDVLRWVRGQMRIVVDPGITSEGLSGDGLAAHQIGEERAGFDRLRRRRAGFPIEVFNVLGAGDGFMSGLLKSWLDGEDWPTTLKYANACGAFAVSRHGCTPAYPSWEELQFFFARGIVRKDLRNDAELEQVHWATNRHGDWSEMRVFAFDHRAQLEEIEGASHDRIGAFKQLCLEAALKVQDGRPGYGILCDGRLGADALSAAEGRGLWIGRPVEWPGSRPLTLERALGPDYGGRSQWPRDQVVKVLCFCHSDDDDEMWSAQEAVVQRLFHAARRNRLEFLLEVIPSKIGLVQDDTTARIIQRFYDHGVYPDWWKLEPFRTEAAWRNAVEAIERNDPRTRGIVVLGLDAPEDELAVSFAIAAKFPLVKGFAVGRHLGGQPDANTSITIMRAPQWGHGAAQHTRRVWGDIRLLGSGAAWATSRNARAVAMLSARLALAKSP